MINKNHTEILAQTKMQSLPGELRRLMTSFEEVQEQVLLDILRYSENTEFGIANGFAQIKNPLPLLPSALPALFPLASPF